MEKRTKILITLVIFILTGSFTLVDIPLLLSFKSLMQDHNIIDNICSISNKFKKERTKNCMTNEYYNSYIFDETHLLLKCRGGIDIVEFFNNRSSNLSIHFNFRQWRNFVKLIDKKNMTRGVHI